MVIRMEQGADDATATPSSLASVQFRMVLPFWYQLIQILLEQRPLNKSVCVKRIRYAKKGCENAVSSQKKPRCNHWLVE